MPESIANRTSVLSSKKDAQQHRKLYEALNADLTDLRTKFNALLTKLDSNHGAATDHVATLKPATPQTGA